MGAQIFNGGLKKSAGLRREKAYFSYEKWAPPYKKMIPPIKNSKWETLMYSLDTWLEGEEKLYEGALSKIETSNPLKILNIFFNSEFKRNTNNT